MITQERLDANWKAITLELDAPAPSRVERALRRVGIPGHVTRLVVATPALRRAWFVALAVVSIVVLALTPENSTSPFGVLLLAPLVPVLGVAFSFGPDADPAHEAHLAAPMRGLRLLAIRTVTTLVVAAAVVTPLAAINEVSRPWAAAWLLPALATTATSLALMTRLPPRRATAAAGGAWIVVALLARAVADDELAAFALPAQVTAVAVAVAAGVVTFAGRERFDRLAVST